MTNEERQARRANLDRMVAHAESKGIPLTRVLSGKQVRFMYDQLVAAEVVATQVSPP